MKKLLMLGFMIALTGCSMYGEVGVKGKKEEYKYEYCYKKMGDHYMMNGKKYIMKGKKMMYDDIKMCYYEMM